MKNQDDKGLPSTNNVPQCRPDEIANSALSDHIDNNPHAQVMMIQK